MARSAIRIHSDRRHNTMARRFTAKMMIAGLALLPAATVVSPAATAQTVVKPGSQEVVLSIGRGQLINVGGTMADVFVANDAVADVQIKSQRQLYVFGKSGGLTTIYASNAKGDIIWSANVRVGTNIDNVDQMMALAMPDAKVAVATMGTNTVLLTGTVAAPEDAAEAQRLVTAFVGEGVNVISRLRTATPLQVNLRVRIAEVSRNFSKTLDSRFGTLGSTGRNDVRFDVNSGGGAPGSTLSAIGKFLGLDFTAALDLAEQDGLVTTLAEPNLTALSGETANFLAGGEFPIVTSNGLSGSSVTYKPYGVSLSYTPVVLANGRISLRVAPQVSEISSVSVVGGVQTAAISKRSAETTVELGSGQSFMIAGLIQNNSINSIDKTPGLGDIPIIGNLFRSNSFKRGETELVIVVTPYLVKPVEDRDIHLPTDGFTVPNEAERLLGNQFIGQPNGRPRPMPTASGTAAVVAPQVGTNAPASDAAVATATPTEARREEKIASAAPGFSFK
jgi:pilus assembly protein CpaC